MLGYSSDRNIALYAAFRVVGTSVAVKVGIL
jgi:hypothetical protein